jgi:ribosomal protein L18E
LSFTTSDAPKVLASAPAVPDCVSCALARIKKASHSGSLSAPAPEPGVLHFDIKEMIVSMNNYRYIVFLIDEHSRFVFYDFIKLKSEAAAAVLRGVAAFEATVGTQVDDEGRALPRPRVRVLHSDREGGLMSHAFREFRATASLHHTTSPSHDHDLNPIAERTIGLISEMATAIRIDSHAPARLWPWIIAFAVDWHNASVTSVGSSTADANITPHQRFTLRPPQVMDLASFGCRAVVLKGPTHQHKPSLSGRGWVGCFLGRSRNSKGSYDVLVDGRMVVSSSSVLVDEEHFDWAPPASRHRPLTSLTHSASPPAPVALLPATVPAVSSNVSGRSTFDLLRGHFLNLFSGPYARADGLSAAMTSLGWKHILNIDNDGEKGGGWSHDLLNDEVHTKLMADATAGKFACMMIAFPCSSSSVARLFDATNNNGGDRGPPIIRDYDNPDGLPEHLIDPKHVRELKLSNLLLDRTVDIAIAARRSPARTTIIFENPSDRSPGASIASAPEFAKHGSIFRTTAFTRLIAEADLTGKATFAYCRLEPNGPQKYTTIYYTPEAGSVLDELNKPEFKCNHERGAHAKRAGGRNPATGEFVSADAAAYPHRLCTILARALTVARTGGDAITTAPKDQGIDTTRGNRPEYHAPSLATSRAAETEVDSDPPTGSGGGHLHAELGPGSSGTPRAPISQPNVASSPLHAPARGGSSPSSPVAFPDLGESASGGSGFDHPGRYWQQQGASTTGVDGRPKRSTAQRDAVFTYSSSRPSRAPPASTPQRPLAPVLEGYSPNGTSAEGYSPYEHTATAVMNSAVAESIHDAHVASAAASDLLPVTDWAPLEARPSYKRGKRLPGGARVIELDVAVNNDDSVKPLEALLVNLNHALRADSPDAPATHAEAMRRGEIWVKSEAKELANHKNNESWLTITRDELPPGRRVHKLIWVYKVKRDGTAKSRLCVQGTTLEAGVDFQQVFSAALRHSSARALFAYAARNGCKVRSVDLIAAYLQGRFIDGEVVYCHLPPGYPELDSKGRPKLAKVMKPIYGIQQAGRRLQRMLFDWLKEQGFESLDDSDPCIFKLTSKSGEVLTIGVYVDNLQIVHSAALDANGRGPDGCAYNAFMDKLASDWDVTDEGPMDDLLGIEIEYYDDGSIKLHQRKYVEKIVERFMPNGPLSKAQRNSLPYSDHFLANINDALSRATVEHPDLVRPMQERLGCLMYATTSTRADIAYPVHQLCKCMHKPTPALLAEVDHVLSYLSRTASLGLTYSREHVRLNGFADASWETKTSTSGWVVSWQSAALSWGSRKQKSIALSTCEAEIIALSEAAKDVVYLRKLVKGLDAAEDGPTHLSTDSKSARDVSYNPEHHDKMKHVERRHFYVRDMVESFELEVPYVPTDQNPADFFTKPMKNATRFRELRRVVMNERD